MYTVLIRGLEFYAFHGVPAEERVVGHRYRVDVEMEVDGRADETDSVSDTVDYGAAASEVVAVGQGQQFKTVEKLARTIGERLLQEHAAIQRVTVTLVKRLPPAPVIAEEAGIRLTVSR